MATLFLINFLALGLALATEYLLRERGAFKALGVEQVLAPAAFLELVHDRVGRRADADRVASRMAAGAQPEQHNAAVVGGVGHRPKSTGKLVFTDVAVEKFFRFPGFYRSCCWPVHLRVGSLEFELQLT